MIHRFFLFIFLFVFTAVNAQSPKEKGLKSINRQSAEAYIRFLASDALEGRKAGEVGGDVSAQYIRSILQDMGVKALVDSSYFQCFEAYATERNARLRYSVHPDSISKYKLDKTSRKLNLKNVLAVIEGKSCSEYIIMGAHYDHLGIDNKLSGDMIYNGADDNASGVSAVLQIAKAFIVSGQKPERTIIFALWDGEELGLLGSEYFVSTSPLQSAIKGYINFDMIGRNNIESKPKQVVYFYTQSHPAFGDWLRKDIKTYNIDLEPDYKPWDKPIGGSDNASFAKRDIPIIWYHTDGHADYHKPTDEIDKINWLKLVEITKASYLNLWNMANLESF